MTNNCLIDARTLYDNFMTNNHLNKYEAEKLLEVIQCDNKISLTEMYLYRRKFLKLDYSNASADALAFIHGDAYAPVAKSCNLDSVYSFDDMRAQVDADKKLGELRDKVASNLLNNRCDIRAVDKYREEAGERALDETGARAVLEQIQCDGVVDYNEAVFYGNLTSKSPVAWGPMTSGADRLFRGEEYRHIAKAVESLELRARRWEDNKTTRTLVPSVTIGMAGAITAGGISAVLIGAGILASVGIGIVAGAAIGIGMYYLSDMFDTSSTDLKQSLIEDADMFLVSPKVLEETDAHFPPAQ